MSRVIKIAAVQMDVAPAPTAERLARAERLVTQAAQAGALLVVLPEVFNTGYEYADANHHLAEPLNGATATWMAETAARLDIHLAGTLMLLDQDEVYNAMLLYAPDGRMWRYDKSYPWGWERGYFRGSERITVAETDLGDLGMMICWDVGHRELWKRYAGRVDLMVISSSPPDLGHQVTRFPDGEQVTAEELGPLMATVREAGPLLFGDMVNQQTAWLGVPAVNGSAAGHFESGIPNARATLLGMLPIAPRVFKYIPRADRMRLSCDVVRACKIVDGGGRVLAELAPDQGETFVTAEVTLAEDRPKPRGRQPASTQPGLMYLLSDVLLPSLSISTYRRGLRRAWGKGMAPARASTRRWTALLGVATAAGILLGLLLGRKKS